MSEISTFANIAVVTDPINMSLIDYLGKIENGEWEDIVTQCRLIKDKDKRDAFKRLMPTSTLSGLFDYRSDGGLKKHSGYLNMDLDDVNNLQEVKQFLEKDKYVYAVFMSTSGTGLRVIFKIKSDKHRESFNGISKYLFENYGLVCDLNGISPSKPYVVSFDPDIHINQNSIIFKDYIKEKTVIKNISDFVYVPSDLKEIVRRITKSQVNICDDYSDWLKVGFALSEGLGEDGRQIFHDLSKISKKYRHERCDRQYTACLKARGTTKANISTLYYLAKINGIPIVSEQTRKIVRITKNSKKAGLSKQQIVENLAKFENIGNTENIVEKVYESDSLNDDEEDSMLPQLEMFISNNFDLQMNEVTGYLEQNGIVLLPGDLNTMFISAKKIIPKLDYQLMMRLLKSDFVEKYNPFFKFLESDGIPVILPPIPEKQKKFDSPLIDKLAHTIETDSQAYTLFFLRKWIVGIISAMHKVHSPLFLALLGKQNTGKTEWFRRLLPTELYGYYAESKLDREKDDEILMCENIIVMDDELHGKSKQESKKFNDITSKQWFSVRRPYGDHNEKILRLAVLGGTSNYMDIISDPTGNRRVIPIVVEGINKVLYNSIDKGELFREAFRLYKDGFDWRIMGEDIIYLNKNKQEHMAIIKERELLEAYFDVPKDMVDCIRMSTTKIAAELEDLTKLKVSINTLGQQLKNLGYKKRGTRLGQGSNTAQLWLLKRINRDGNFPQYVPPTLTGNADLEGLDKDSKEDYF